MQGIKEYVCLASPHGEMDAGQKLGEAGQGPVIQARQALRCLSLSDSAEGRAQVRSLGRAFQMERTACRQRSCGGGKVIDSKFTESWRARSKGAEDINMRLERSKS